MSLETNDAGNSVGFIHIDQITRNNELFIKGDSVGLKKLADKIIAASENKNIATLYDDETDMKGETEAIIITWEYQAEIFPQPYQATLHDKLVVPFVITILLFIIFTFLFGLYHILQLLLR